MQTRVVQSLLFGFGVRCLVACSVPEAAAAPHKETGPIERDVGREQRTVDRRRKRIQRQILSDLRALKNGQKAQSRQGTGHRQRIEHPNPQRTSC